MNHSSANKSFNPPMWILCHETKSRLAEHKNSLAHYCERNPLFRFQHEHAFAQADFDTLPQVVEAAAKAGHRTIKVFRMDNITMLDRLQPINLSRNVSRLNAIVQESRIHNTVQGFNDVEPDPAVLSALSSTAPRDKFELSKPLEGYIKALAEWAGMQYQTNPKMLKRSNRSLHAILEHCQGDVASAAATMLATVTGKQSQGAGNPQTPLAQRFSSGSGGTPGRRS